MSLEQREILEEVESGQLDIHEGAKQLAETKTQQKVDTEVTDIRTLLAAYDFKVLDDKNETRLQGRLESQNEGTRQEAKAEIIARANNIREYMTKLSTGDRARLVDGTYENIFNIDTAAGIDQKQDYVDMFTGLSLSEQVDWLRKIDEDITSRIEQFSMLTKLVGKNAREEEMNKFRTLRTAERKPYLERLENTNVQFEQLILSPHLTSAEKREARETFDELGLSARLIEIDRLKKLLKQNPKSEEFRALDKKWTKGIKKFETLDDQGKEKVLSEIRNKMKTTYLDLLNSCSALTREDLRLMRPTVRGRFDMKLAEACIGFFGETKKLAEKAEAEGKKFPSEVLNHFDWNDITSLDRQKLLKKGVNGKNELERYAEDIDHIRFDKDYKDKLEKYAATGEYGLITKSAVKEYYEWFKKKDTKEKERILSKEKGADFLEDTIEDRKKLNQRFAQLQPHIKNEFEKEFREGGFEERKKLFDVQKIDTEPERLDQEFTAKVEDMIKDETLSPKSRDKYLKWYKKLGLKDKIKYANESSLDNKDREKQKDLFKEQVLKAAPEDEHRQLAKEFRDSNLKTRKQLNRKWLKQYANLTDTEIDEQMGIEETNPESTNFQVKLFLDHGEKAENEGDLQTALTFYKSALDLDTKLDKETEAEIRAKIEQIEADLGNYDEEIESGHFEMILENEIDKILSTDKTLAREQEKLTIVEGMYKLKKRTELLFNKQANTDDLMDATLKGEEETVRDLNEAMLEHTDDEKGLVKNSQGRLEVADQIEFDIDMFAEEETRYQRFRSFIAEKQAQPPERQWDSRVKLVDRKSNQDFTADQYKTQKVDKYRSNMTEQLGVKLLKKMGINPKTAPKSTLIYIQNHLATRDYTKRIPRTAETARKAV